MSRGKLFNRLTKLYQPNVFLDYNFNLIQEAFIMNNEGTLFKCKEGAFVTPREGKRFQLKLSPLIPD